MDAFSVSLANGLQEPYIKKRKMTLIAGVFGFFQFAMLFIGWICVNMLIDVFQFLSRSSRGFPSSFSAPSAVS